MTKAIKAVLLCAGKGSRLGSVTELTPKPLISFLGKTLLEAGLNKLSRAGAEQIGINCHHLAKQIAQAALSSPQATKITLSFEKELLGTGGAFCGLKEVGLNGPLIAASSDVISDFPIKRLFDFHQEQMATATMGLLPNPIEGEQSVFVQEDIICGFGYLNDLPQGCSAHAFSNYQVLSQDFIDKIVKKPASVLEYYKAAIASNERICAFVYAPHFWFDLGTKERYYQALLSIQDKLASTPHASIDALYACGLLT